MENGMEKNDGGKMETKKVKVFGWNSEKGFGFVEIDGKRLFLHVRSIQPEPPRDSKLNGREIIVLETEEGYRGPKVKHAITLIEWERRQFEAEEFRKKSEERERETERIKEIAKRNFPDNSKEIWSLIEDSIAESYYGEIEKFPGISYRCSFKNINTSLEEPEAVIKITLEVEVSVIGLNGEEGLEKRELVKEIRGQEVWKFLEPTWTPNFQIESDGSVSAQWQGTYYGVEMSFRRDSIPATFSAPTIEVYDGWEKRPICILQGVELKLCGRKFKFKITIWPQRNVNVGVRIGGEFEKPFLKLKEYFENWNQANQLEEIMRSARLSVKTAPHKFVYRVAEQVWNNRDSDELCDWYQRITTHQETHLALLVNFSNCPLFADYMQIREWDKYKDVVWTHALNIDGLDATDIKKELQKWILKQVRGIDVGSSDKIIKLAENFADKIYNLAEK